MICPGWGSWINITISMVYSLDAPLVRFFALSTAVHLLFIFLWPKPEYRSVRQDAISVAFLPAPKPEVVKPRPAPKENPSKPVPAPRQVPTRPSRAPAIIARKSSPVLEEKPIAPQARSPQPVTKPQESPPVSKAREPQPVKPVEERIAITERPLPTLKELLPPLTWQASGTRDSGRDGPVHLDTKNPQYITYFGSIKRAIELVWQYPEPALRYGLQGKLLLEFAILANGRLAGARIIRSSGSNVLDEEAMRAVKAAAPFEPIPPWIDKNRLDIIASFEYLDNRLNYRYMR